MKNRINALILGLVALFNMNAAHATDDALLYSVSGNGLTDTSYIYGTIHMICADDFSIADKVTKAFKSTAQLYLEVDMDDPKEMKDLMSAAKGKKKLTEILIPEQQKRLDEKLQAEVCLPLAALKDYSLATIQSLFMMKGLGCDNIKSYEQEFLTMAQAESKEVLGMEKAKFQIKVLKKSTNAEDQFEDLFDPRSVNVLEGLIENYKNEDMIALSEMFSETSYMDDNMREWLLVKRNNNWVEKMPKIMKEKSTFFAVGAAHLLGDIGILDLLRAEGYIVTPIKD